MKCVCAFSFFFPFFGSLSGTAEEFLQLYVSVLQMAWFSYVYHSFLPWTILTEWCILYHIRKWYKCASGQQQCHPFKKRLAPFIYTKRNKYTRTFDVLLRAFQTPSQPPLLPSSSPPPPSHQNCSILSAYQIGGVFSFLIKCFEE